MIYPILSVFLSLTQPESYFVYVIYSSLYLFHITFISALNTSDFVLFFCKHILDCVHFILNVTDTRLCYAQGTVYHLKTVSIYNTFQILLVDGQYFIIVPNIYYHYYLWNHAVLHIMPSSLDFILCIMYTELGSLAAK